MAKFQALKGFRDFYPDDLAARAQIFSAWRSAAELHGFLEYDGPALEPLDLYTQKSGDEIVGQLYSFSDKGGRDVAMRPEMTPTIARMVAARWQSMPKPVRWFSIPQLYRYERPQAGRLREHYQFNVDIFGEGTIRAEAELLAIIIRAMRTLGLSENDVEIRLSDRQLLNEQLLKLQIGEDKFPTVYSVLDKFDRTDESVSFETLIKGGVSEASIESLFDLIHRFRNIRTPEQLKELTGAEDTFLMLFYELYCILGAGHRSWVTIDLAIVRGLGYYTGTVFEVFDRARKFRAICGGGRYDRLLQDLGGVSAPAAGFGWGDVVIAELLREKKLPVQQAPCATVVVARSSGDPESPDRFAAVLRDRGVSVLAVSESQAGRYQSSEYVPRGLKLAFMFSADGASIFDAEHQGVLRTEHVVELLSLLNRAVDDARTAEDCLGLTRKVVQYLREHGSFRGFWDA